MTHEICHMFGLQHCYYFECALNESSSIAEAEQQPLFLCPVCLRKLHKVLKFDVANRYDLLHQKLSEVSSVVRLQETLPQPVDAVAEKPYQQSSSENPHREEASFIISTSPSRIPSKMDQTASVTETTQLLQQQQFINATEWLKKCIHFIDNIN